MTAKTFFIDWSGDLGLRFGHGSSNYVAIALVHVADYVAFCQSAVNLRAQRRLGAHYEYHYAHIPKSERAAYFTMLRDTDLAAWVLIADKRKLDLEWHNWYDAFRPLITNLAGRVPLEVMENAILIIDEPDARSETIKVIRVAFSIALRTRGARRGIRKARGYPAHREDGIQLADMVAGAVMEMETGTDTRLLARLGDKVRVWWFEDETSGE